jgi:hypothetical protein
MLLIHGARTALPGLAKKDISRKLVGQSHNHDIAVRSCK